MNPLKRIGAVTEEVQPKNVEMHRGHYFIDEAGDASLFDARGHNLIGTDGCSRFSMLGLLDVKYPEALAENIADLRTNLVADPYFKDIPSMQVQQRKTALFFHAKDDIPEVRREVYSLLMRHDIRFHAVVQDKQEVLKYVKVQNDDDDSFRYHPNQSYDYQVKCLLNGKLHKKDLYDIHFSRRGKSDRTEALLEALERQRKWYLQEFKIEPTACVLNVSAHYPWNMAGLQAVDYFLWALQRFYERGESRYLEFVWTKCAVINDRHIPGRNNSGTFYTQKKPPSLAALKEARGI